MSAPGQGARGVKRRTHRMPRSSRAPGATRARHRMRVAIATLCALGLLAVVLAISSSLLPRVDALRSLGSPVDEEGRSRQDSVRELILPTSDLEVTGFSESPVIIGFSTPSRPAIALMEVDQAMRCAKWEATGQASASVRSYVREPVELWDGVTVTTAFVSMHDIDEGTTAIVIELL